MTSPISASPSLSIHATNISGIGAIQVVSELLPRLEKYAKDRSIDVFLPQSGTLSQYHPILESTQIHHYRRVLPNNLSRVAECLFMGRRFSRNSPLLTLGDIPIRGCHQQTVFLHQPHIIPPSVNSYSTHSLGFAISRMIFRANLPYVRWIIVQTEAMRDALHQAYPSTRNRTVVIPQPAPSWIHNHPYTPNTDSAASGLKLFYPAAFYPHKNHSLFSKIDSDKQTEWPVREIVLTISPEVHPNPNLDWLKCTGMLAAAQLMEQYSQCHALLFPSVAESYGLPLIEAMTLGLPIVVADLPYAHILCGDQGIYFDPDSPESLRLALLELQRRLQSGWRPNWSSPLAGIPNSWDEVACRILDLMYAPEGFRPDNI